MKKLIFFFAVCAGAFWLPSCTEDEGIGVDIPQSQESVVTVTEVTDSVIVNQSELDRVLASMRSNSDKVRSRGADTYTVEVIKDGEGQDAIYVVNYANNGGFYVISARKDGLPILAFNDTGNFDPASLAGSFSDLWLRSNAEMVTHAQELCPDDIAQNRQAWKQFEAKQPFALSETAPSRSLDPAEMQRLKTIMRNAVIDMQEPGKQIYTYDELYRLRPDKAEEMKELLIGGMMYPEYWDDFEELCLFVDYDEAEETVSSCMTDIHWYQGETIPAATSFNMSYPVWDTGVRCLVGCGPLAIGQIMRYYKHPAKYDWNAMPLTYPTKTTSDFLYDLTTQSGPDYNYDNGEVGTGMKNLQSTLQKNGYSVDFRYSFSFADLSYPSVLSIHYIKKGTSIQKHHAIVVSGVRAYQYDHKFEVWSFKNGYGVFEKVYTETSDVCYGPGYYYVNCGWSGNQGTAWYSNLESYVPSADYEKGEIGNMLINIKPKK